MYPVKIRTLATCMLIIFVAALVNVFRFEFGFIGLSAKQIAILIGAVCAGFVLLNADPKQ